ncbi:hypothetical protein, partial [Microcystis aeruginosa]|uniref:hypothetical protein n=1 Tax=Microcystis aeruginosa TaxID=1126 RepID=UPI001C10DED1
NFKLYNPPSLKTSVETQLMSYYQIIINDFARLSDGVLGNSRQPNLPSTFLFSHKAIYSPLMGR